MVLGGQGHRPDAGAGVRARLRRAFPAGVVALVALFSVATTGQQTSTSAMNAIAERYVKLVLALGQHDAGYVDSYYGPAAWKDDAARQKRPLADIDAEAARAIRDLGGRPSGGDEILALRHDYLARQLESLRARVRMLSGVRMTFDEESDALYDAVAPNRTESYFQTALDELDRRLPGKGSLIDRYDAYRQAFVIPRDRLARVFELAIGEARRRTLAHVALPAGESFRVEYVTNKSWSGYNWYQGQYHSLIQVNTDLPIYIDRAVDLGCHEGYPGHHVFNVLLEQSLVRDRGWIEMTVYPLFSPQSLIAEGSANYGIEVAFPSDERLSFERDVLFPAAGLDPGQAEEYYAIQAIVGRLAYADNEAARRYLNGEIPRETAAAWLTRFALMPLARADQRVRFMDDYRSYVINYNLGKDLVKQYVEAHGGTASQPARRWQIFADLLRSPRLPSGLR
jgi:hypothetical protein